MIEEDLFFPGKPTDDNEDESNLNADSASNETLVSNGTVTLGLRPMPQIDEQRAVKSFSDTGKNKNPTFYKRRSFWEQISQQVRFTIRWVNFDRHRVCLIHLKCRKMSLRVILVITVFWRRFGRVCLSLDSSIRHRCRYCRLISNIIFKVGIKVLLASHFLK